MNIKLIIKGFIIGIAKIIPGVSGALLAISLGLYDKGLKAITTFFDHPKDNFKFLFNIGIGLIISIITFSKIIIYLITNYYLLTMLFFIGLILGGIIPLFKKINRTSSNYLLFFFSLSIIIIISITNLDNNYIPSNNFKDIIYYFLGGILDACGTIIPGISGTALLMINGLYNLIIEAISNIYLLDNLRIIIPFGLGIVIGIILLAKIMNFFFTNHENKTYTFILGVSIGSIIILLIKTFSIEIKILELVIGLPLLILGIYLSHKLDN